MKRLLRDGLPLFLLLCACAPRRPAMAERPTNEQPQPEVGIVRWVETRRISVFLPGADQPKEYARTPGSRVFSEGLETPWAELRAGQAVRIQSVQGPFTPVQVTAIDILSGEEEAAVRREILAREGASDRAHLPSLRNLHVSIGRGS